MEKKPGSHVKEKIEVALTSKRLHRERFEVKLILEVNKMEIITTYGGYFAVHVACAENACTRWHNFNFKPWHVGIFAKTRHGLTLVGVVSNVGRYDYTWWANCHGEFYAEIHSRDDGYFFTPDDCEELRYRGSYRDFLDCVEAAAAFLDEDEDEDY